jgi:hypothetical protein
MLKHGKAQVQVIPSGSDWFGVTYAADKETAVDALQSLTHASKYPSPLWNN